MDREPVALNPPRRDRLTLTTAVGQDRFFKSMDRDHAFGFLVAVWALLVMPALCTAGFIEHPCDCGNTTGCTHEADCGGDPCSIVTLRHDNGAAKGTDLVPTLALFVLLPPASAVTLSVQGAHKTETYEPPLRARLPYPALTAVLLV